MSDNPKKEKYFDRAINTEEYIEDVLKRTRLACGFCGARNWVHADYSIDNAKIEACSECHDITEQGEFIRRFDA
jgi:hypothetical protein